VESAWSVSKLSTESVGSRRELVANCVHTADATKQCRRVAVGGVYWALVMPNTYRRRDEAVELRRVGGVNTPVGSRDPVYNFLC